LFRAKVGRLDLEPVVAGPDPALLLRAELVSVGDDPFHATRTTPGSDSAGTVT
jgi:hypothetical protein